MFHRNDVKGGALYYAIFISFIVTLLGGLLTMNVMLHNVSDTEMLNAQRYERNISSALILISEKPDILKMDGYVNIDLYGDDLDKVSAFTYRWGGYQLLKIDSGEEKRKISCIALFGKDISGNEKIALDLSDKGQALSLSGHTIIKGDCRLPKSGLRKAYIDGRSFSGSTLVDGKISASKPELISTGKFLKKNLDCIKDPSASYDSIVNISSFPLIDTMRNSFFNKTLQLYSQNWIMIDAETIEGNIRIVSQKGVTISGSAKTSEIIVCAPKIETGENFCGNLQLFATDSIIIKKGARFLFPSVIAIPETSNKLALINIEENCIISGDIFLGSNTLANNHDECRINKGSVLTGTVYCDGNLQLNGTIHGRVITKGFVLRTSGSIYENHLLDATIDVSLLPPMYSSAFSQDQADKFKIIKLMR